MATVVFGGLVSEVRGSIGGDTFSRNRYSAYVRQRTKPVNPNTPKQVMRRNWLNTCQQGWKTLTSTQQDAWNNYALGVTFTNAHGNTYSLNGQMLFIKYNLKKTLDYEDEGIDKFLTPDLPDSPIEVWRPGPALVEYTGAGPTVALVSVTCEAPDGTPQFEHLKRTYFAAITSSKNIRNVENRWRFIGTGFSASGATPDDITTKLTDTFGPLYEGHTLHLKVQYVNYRTGEESTFAKLPATKLAAAT